ncbi:MAG TPA: type II toxin-antitoxin system VapC family toxin [Candidatus Binatia bacterium]|nr:type II toxin-antitoxin system VapC family toxin [Candidatus Binatia bacterium]
MTLYLDTSALVKLYVTEDGSHEVKSWVAAASAIFTASITYAETRAALAQSWRAGALSQSDLRRAVMEFDAAWKGYAVVEVSEALVLRAGGLAEEHALRGYDAVQLAAALDARPSSSEHVFASFDLDLNAAAAREGLRLADLPDGVAERPATPYRARLRRADRPRVAASGRSR